MTLATPVPPQAGQCFSLMAGARVRFHLAMILSPQPHVDGFPHGETMRSASPWLKGQAPDQQHRAIHVLTPANPNATPRASRREQHRADAGGAGTASYRPRAQAEHAIVPGLIGELVGFLPGRR